MWSLHTYISYSRSPDIEVSRFTVDLGKHRDQPHHAKERIKRRDVMLIFVCNDLGLFFSWSDRLSAACRGSRGEYGASAAARRRCFSRQRAIDKQPIDKTHRFPTHHRRMQQFWFTPATKTSGCLRQCRAMFQTTQVGELLPNGHLKS